MCSGVGSGDAKCDFLVVLTLAARLQVNVAIGMAAMAVAVLMLFCSLFALDLYRNQIQVAVANTALRDRGVKIAG